MYRAFRWFLLRVVGRDCSTCKHDGDNPRDTPCSSCSPFLSEWTKRASGILAVLALLSLAGCVSTTFTRSPDGSMSMNRTAPMWLATGIGEVTFYDETGKIIAQMKGYQNDGSSTAIRELGKTLETAGKALSTVAVEQVKP